MNYKEGLRKILEDTSYSGGQVLGSSPDIGNHGGDFQASDWFAPGDFRNPYGLDTNSKKGKKKKKKKPHLYRRAFVESVDDDYIELNCVLFCCDEYRDVAERLVEKLNIDIVDDSELLIITGDDSTIQNYIENLSNIVGEGVFEENYLAFICEMNNYQDILKKPKMNDDDYNQEQLRIGTEVELEHTPDRRLARQIAKNHLDEDEFYYDKLKVMERTPKHPDQPKEVDKQRIYRK